MSPRAAWQLERLGFADVYDYVAGKVDWLAAGVPSEGPDAKQPRAGAFVADDAPTCGVDDRVADIRSRVDAAGWDSCVVLNAQQIVLGHLHRSDLDDHGDDRAGIVMEIGPTTVRANEPLGGLLQRMADRHVQQMIVTTAEGRFIGVLRRHDAEQRLGTRQNRTP